MLDQLSWLAWRSQAGNQNWLAKPTSLAQPGGDPKFVGTSWSSQAGPQNLLDQLAARLGGAKLNLQISWTRPANWLGAARPGPKTCWTKQMAWRSRPAWEPKKFWTDRLAWGSQAEAQGRKGPRFAGPTELAGLAQPGRLEPKFAGPADKAWSSQAGAQNLLDRLAGLAQPGWNQNLLEQATGLEQPGWLSAQHLLDQLAGFSQTGNQNKICGGPAAWLGAARLGSKTCRTVDCLETIKRSGT